MSDFWMVLVLKNGLSIAMVDGVLRMLFGYEGPFNLQQPLLTYSLSFNWLLIGVDWIQESSSTFTLLDTVPPTDLVSILHGHSHKNRANQNWKWSGGRRVTMHPITTKWMGKGGGVWKEKGEDEERKTLLPKGIQNQYTQTKGTNKWSLPSVNLQIQRRNPSIPTDLLNNKNNWTNSGVLKMTAKLWIVEQMMRFLWKVYGSITHFILSINQSSLNAFQLSSTAFISRRN